MDNLRTLAQAYRSFLLELGEELREVKNNKEYEGFADTFIDAIKSPEIGFTVSEAETLIKMHNMFCLLDIDDLPSHNIMKLMVNKNVDMDLLESAKTLSLADFRELIKDEELGTQERTYTYEVVKRSVESGSIRKVYGEELEEAVSKIQEGLVK